MVINQYDIFWIDLNPTVGSEINKVRPCLIISPNEMNKYLKTVIIAPITSREKGKTYPMRVNFILAKKNAWIVLDQIRTVDKTRLKQKITSLPAKYNKEVKNIIREMLVE
jgi:mRNA interferase MazF